MTRTLPRSWPTGSFFCRRAASRSSERGTNSIAPRTHFFAISFWKTHLSPRWTSPRDGAHSARSETASASRDGVLGCPALQYCRSTGPPLDRRRRAQRRILHHPLGSRGTGVFRTHGARGGRAFVPVSGGGRFVCLDE